MHRTIKFRAWDEDGFMFYPDRLDFKDDRITVWNGNTFGGVGTAIAQLMQFTGLLDKNGKEIYEGDIYATLFPNGEWGSPQIVTWNNELAGFGLLPNEICEIFGNIYENPELLK
jgi:uncharacterized phage protein (TIGR01671 family)